MKEKNFLPKLSKESRLPAEQEKETGAHLSIREPDGDKNFMVTFTGRNEEESMAYNLAIEEVLQREKLSPFHQIGATFRGPNSVGYHGWEVWRETNREKLSSLLPEIETKAGHILKTLSHK